MWSSCCCSRVASCVIPPTRRNDFSAISCLHSVIIWITKCDIWLVDKQQPGKIQAYRYIILKCKNIKSFGYRNIEWNNFIYFARWVSSIYITKRIFRNQSIHTIWHTALTAAHNTIGKLFILSLIIYCSLKVWLFPCFLTKHLNISWEPVMFARSFLNQDWTRTNSGLNQSYTRSKRGKNPD